jgi:hypothetical protein
MARVGIFLIIGLSRFGLLETHYQSSKPQFVKAALTYVIIAR